jgi:hypothetical protein
VFGLYTSFPARAAGIGLLLLRISVAAALFMDAPEELMIPHLVPELQALLALGLSLGFLTPVLSLLCCVLAGARLFGGGAADFSPMIGSILSAAGLTLLGPGAYSLDARLFGRRVVVFPSDGHRPV